MIAVLHIKILFFACYVRNIKKFSLSDVVYVRGISEVLT